MPRNKRVFPFFLDEGIQEVAGTGTTAWEGISSFVEFTGTQTKEITLGSEDKYGRPIQHGTLVVVKRTQASTNGLTVNPSADFSSNDGQIVLKAAGDHAVFLWKAPGGSNTLGEWVEMTFDIASSFTDATLVNPTLDGRLKLNHTTGATSATGSDFAGAANLIISDPVHKVSGSANQGVKLLAGAPTITCKIINTRGNALKLYPESETTGYHRINGLADGAAFTLAANAIVTVIFNDDGNDDIIYIG
jgi:hypothetical protein